MITVILIDDNDATRNNDMVVRIITSDDSGDYDMLTVVITLVIMVIKLVVIIKCSCNCDHKILLITFVEYWAYVLAALNIGEDYVYECQWDKVNERHFENGK